MSTLIELPAELFEEILSLLPVSNYSNLSRTCKILHACLSPRIYHTIDWFWQDNRPPPPYHLLLRTLLSNAQLASYVKILKLRGGGIVRVEEWESGTCDDDDGGSGWRPIESARSIWGTDGRQARSSFSSTDVQKVISLISSIAPSGTQRREWNQEFNRGNVDVITALILHQSQAIERLDLRFRFMHRSTFIPRVFRRLMSKSAHDTTAIYPHLVSVNLGVDGPETPGGIWADFDMYRLFFFLPNTVHINSVLIEPAVFAWPSPKRIPQSNSLTTLILRKCTASEDTLGKILSCTPKLKHLVYDYYRLVGLDRPHWECYKEICDEARGLGRPKVSIHCPRLSKALAHLQNTLESLVLKVRFESDRWSDVMNNIRDPCEAQYLCHVIGRIAGLEKMNALKRLEISWALLFGWWDEDLEEANNRCSNWYAATDPHDGVPGAEDNPWTNVLPPNIERLCMRDDMSDHDDYPHAALDPVQLLGQLLDTRKHTFKTLVYATFVFVQKRPYSYKEWPVQLMRRLHNECEDGGLECEIIGEERLSGLREVMTFPPAL